LPIVAIIPARYASTRLPGKPLCDILGKSMIQHVYERARRAHVDRVLVATDDGRIASAVRAFGGEALMTSPAHRSGTDRLAEALEGVAADIVVNVQGDEPLIDPQYIDATVAPLRDDPTVEMATPATPLLDADEFLAPDVVKLVRDARGDALYFSRSPIPYARDGSADDTRAAAQAAIERGLAWRHIGLYAYRRATLLRLAALPAAPLEEVEALEQLRALTNGIRIRVVPVSGTPGIAVDTPQDLERARALMAYASTDVAHPKGATCPPNTSL
jgi:3-deoxy-manno-octulosonate cytidylyltransferase (CMP-KDO synthetase)